MERKRVDYYPGIFDPYKSDMNMEHWIEALPFTKWKIPFPEVMWGLGLEMDSFNGFMEKNPRFVSTNYEDVNIKKQILEVLKESDVSMMWLPIFNLGMKLQTILPPGVFNVVGGDGTVVGDAIIEHPGISKVSFTGSTATGREIAMKAGHRLIPATVELGGKSPIVLFDDADIEKCVQFAMLSVFSSSGAVCVAGSRLIVQDTIYDRVIELLKEACTRVVVGDPFDKTTQMGPIASEGKYNTIMELIECGRKEADLVCGGERLTGGVYDKGFYIGPTVFANVDNKSTIASKEIFGPVLCVIKFHTEEEAVALANDTEYGLGGGIFTRDLRRAIKFGREIKAGTVWVNTYLDSCPGSPFGGYKNSGMGRELHSMALDAYSNIKNINIDFGDSSPVFF